LVWPLSPGVYRRDRLVTTNTLSAIGPLPVGGVGPCRVRAARCAL